MATSAGGRRIPRWLGATNGHNRSLDLGEGVQAKPGKPVYVVFSRVSSREQQREGWSLEIQDEAARKYVERAGGVIDRAFKVAETATRREERKTFREMINYVKKHAGKITGVLFYKINRAARNLEDYLELERLETEHGVQFISLTEPSENTPTGRMMRRQLALMASFFTEQQSVDVREGQRRRIEAGLFLTAPYGYRNVRHEMRGLIEVVEEEAWKVRLIFELYAWKRYTLDMIVEHLNREGITYLPNNPRWDRSVIEYILKNRAYIGEVKYQGQWYPGTHTALVDRQTWDRIRVLLGQKVYHAHELTFAGGLITCAHCGCLITGECVKKPNGKTYIYYRCVKYKAEGHPHVRLTEDDLDAQVMTLFERIRLSDAVRDWFGRMVRQWSLHQQKESRVQADVVQRQLSLLRGQEDQLLNLRLAGEIEPETFAAKKTELRDRIASYMLQLDSTQQGRDDHADLAAKVFELSQSLKERWLSAGYAAKRRILEILCLNWTLDGATLVPEWRKPFDVLVEGLSVQLSRGDKI